MFSPSTYQNRRQVLIEAEEPRSGLVLLLGNEQIAMNYRANPYPFRQDSTFLYYFGVDVPGLAGVIDLDEGSSRLYGEDQGLDEVVWMGERPSIQEYANRAGVRESCARSTLSDDLGAALQTDRPIHFLPPYRARHNQRIEALLGLRPARIEEYVSASLTRAVVRQRSLKSSEEIQELERAVDVTATMHKEAMRSARAGRTEREVAGRLTGIAESQGRGLAFRPTCSVHGEVLHNHVYSNQLDDEDLLLVDAGAASPEHYAGDITRVTPVGESFTPRQRAVYQAVLSTQHAAIDAIEPGVSFRDIHLLASRVLAEHLIEIGLMQGDAEAAVAAGAHALFFPHGLGHMLGLDTHEMENLGEDVVGYASDQNRSEQFGLHTLRLARPLETGFVVTIEPGCYFIPELIQQWRSENQHAAFIDYDAAESFADFGGIRIEDDILVTENGARVLGPGIPKTMDEVETLAGTGHQTA